MGRKHASQSMVPMPTHCSRRAKVTLSSPRCVVREARLGRQVKTGGLYATAKILCQGCLGLGHRWAPLNNAEEPGSRENVIRRRRGS